MRVMRQTFTVFKKYIVLTLRNPYMVMIGIGQPLLYLYLFGPLLTSLAPLNPKPGVTSYDIFVPGIVLQLVLFGAAFAGMGTVTEWRSGELERVLATPASRFALLSGRVARDVVFMTGEVILLLLAAVTLGLRQSLPNVLLTLVFAAILTVAVASMSYFIALATKDEGALSGIAGGLVLPLMLLAGAILPMSLAPRWLFILSRFNPLSYVLDAMRGIFANNLSGSDFLQAAAVSIVLAVVLFMLAYRKMNSNNQ